MTHIDDVYLQDGVPFRIDIEKTFGHIYRVTDGVIVCGNGEEGSFIAPERGCLLRWERYEQPNVIFDVSDFGEIAEQAKPIDRWRHSLLEAERIEREKASKPKAIRRRRITENDKRAIKRMIGEGVKRKDIAAQLGISPQAVSKHAPQKRRTTRKTANHTVPV